MGKLTWFGWSPPHDPIYGIDHANIAPELTRENWKTRAVVRSGMYIWVLRGTHTGKTGKKVARYYVRIYATAPTLELQRDFPKLMTALDYANRLGNSESRYPTERGSTTYITMHPGLGTGPLTFQIPMKKGE